MKIHEAIENIFLRKHEKVYIKYTLNLLIYLKRRMVVLMTLVVLLLIPMLLPNLLPSSDLDENLLNHTLSITAVWSLLRLLGITDSVLTDQDILDEHNTDVGQALALSVFDAFVSKALSKNDGVLRANNMTTNTVVGRFSRMT